MYVSIYAVYKYLQKTYDVCFQQYVIFDTPHADTDDTPGACLPAAWPVKACAHRTARAHLASGGGISSSARVGYTSRCLAGEYIYFA